MASSRHRVITLYAVMAWCIRRMTLLGAGDPSGGHLHRWRTPGYARRYGRPKVTNLQTAMLVTAMRGLSEPEARSATGSPDQVARLQPSGDRSGILRGGGRIARIQRE